MLFIAFVAGLEVAVIAVFFAGAAVAQQCSPAAGGSVCETGGGVASLGDPDGSNLTVGNPIHPVTGNKYQEELDAPPLPGAFGLEIRRHYNSNYVSADGPWGRGWSLSYDTRVYRSGSVVQVIQADGRRLVFNLPQAASDGPSAGPSHAHSDGACVPAAPGQGRLYIEADGYRWVWPRQRELHFDSRGSLVQIRPVGGDVDEAVRISRDADGRIVRVTDPAGRHMQFSYDPSGYLSGIEHPLGHWRYRVDGAGRVESVRAPDGVVRRYRYDDIGHRSRFTAISVAAPGVPEQVIGQWAYDSHGRATRYRRADGSEIRLQLDQEPNGERVSVLTNALGGRTSFRATEMAGRWRVTEIRGPGCAECGPTGMRMRYDRDGQLTARWKIGGDGVEYRRDRQARVVQAFALRDAAAGKDPVASGVLLWRLEYADEDSPWPSLVARPSVVPGREASLSIERDRRGNVLSVTQSGYAPALVPARGSEPVSISRTVRMRHALVSGRRMLTGVDGPMPNGPAGDPTDSDVTLFRHDDKGQVASVVFPAGATRRIEARDAGGRPSVIVDSDGYREVVRQAAYNLRGELVSLTSTGWLLDRAGQRRPGSRVVQRLQREFDPLGRPVTLVDAAGRITRHDYDAAGRRSGIRDARGYRSAVRRDAEGQVQMIALHEPGSEEPLRATYFGRDPDGKLQSLLLPDGRQFRFHHDLAGHAIGFTDPDRSLHLALPAGSVMPVPVAGAGPTLGLAAGRSELRDDFGRVVLRTSQDHGSKTLAYDEADRMVETVDATGSRIFYRYDAAGRLLASGAVAATSGASRSVAVHHDVTYAYEGRYLMTVDGPAQQTRHRRDALGRVVQTAIGLAGLQGGPKILYTVRDPVTGLVSEMGLADGQSVRLQRGSAASGGNVRRLTLRNRFWSSAGAGLRRWMPAAIASPADGLVPGRIIADDIEVHPFNGLSGLRHGNGIVLSRRFDLAGRTIRLRSEGAGAIVSDWHYGYGAGPRIRSIGPAGQRPVLPSGNSGTRHFEYDHDGALRVRAEGDLAPSPGLSRTSASGRGVAIPGRDEAAERDPAGRLARDRRFRYAYTAAGQLAEVRAAGNGALLATYAYNHLGQRIRKSRHGEADGIVDTVYFLWNEGRLVAEVAPDGTVVAQYLSLSDGRRILPVAKLERGAIRPGRGRMQVRGPAARSSGTKVVFAIHADHRGAPVAMSDAQGRLVWRASLAAAGFATIEARQAGTELNLRLPGQYRDAETGLHDNWHRTYDPSSGRYLQPDPLGYPDGPDPYRYAGGDPVNRIDPLGLYEIDVHYYMTFFLGVTAGLDPEEARIVALAAQYVDNNPLTRPVDNSSLGSTIGSVLHNQQQLLGYHFVLSATDGRTLPQFRNAILTNPDSPQLRNLLAAAGSSVIGRNGSLQFLGEYLHALADTYSHRDASDMPYDALVADCGLGHGHALHEPDLTYDDIVDLPNPWDEGQPPPAQSWHREARTLEMELTLHRVLLGYGNPDQARQRQEIETVLRAFNALREQETSGTVGDFAGKLEVLQRGLAKLGYGQIDLTSLTGFGYDVQRAARNRQIHLRTTTGAPLREEDFPGVCLEGGRRCAPG